MPREANVPHYLEQGGARCPYCNSSNIQADDTSFDGGTMSQEVRCSNCRAEWYDIYRLVDIEPINPPVDEDLSSEDPLED